MLHVFGLHKVGTREFEVSPGYVLNISVFHDENGKLWDDLHPQFRSDTFKLLLDDTWMVRGYGSLADGFVPYEDEICHIVEVAYEDLPEDFFNPGMSISWSWFKDKGVVRRWMSDEENSGFNKVMRDSLVSEINVELQPLQLAEKYGELTEEESE